MTFKKHEKILFERFDDQILVFDLKKNIPYVLNRIAAYILENSDGEKNQRMIAERICREFDVEYPQALNDIEDIYREFIWKELVIKVE